MASAQNTYDVGKHFTSDGKPRNSRVVTNDLGVRTGVEKPPNAEVAEEWVDAQGNRVWVQMFKHGWPLPRGPRVEAERTSARARGFLEYSRCPVGVLRKEQLRKMGFTGEDLAPCDAVEPGECCKHIAEVMKRRRAAYEEPRAARRASQNAEKNAARELEERKVRASEALVEKLVAVTERAVGGGRKGKDE